MKNKTKLICIVLIVILTIGILGACIPEKVKEVQIRLFNNYLGDNYVGFYECASAKQLGRDRYSYEVKPGKQEGLLDVFRDSKFFVCEFELVETVYFKEYGTVLKIGKNALWLTTEGDIYVCQSRGNKYVETYYIGSEISFDNEDETMFVRLNSSLIISDDDKVKFDKPYSTPFAWEHFRRFFPQDKVDDSQKSIELSCRYKEEGDTYYEHDGVTKLFYKDNTIEISSDYTPLQQDKVKGGEK